jgi:tetratricopeptide (TPR) repeat protein
LYVQAIASYPSSGVAPDLLDELDAAAIPVSDYTRGVVEYRAFRNDASRASLQRAVAAGDNAAEATYYLGALDERADDPASAIAAYQTVYELDPTSTLADDALWWRGRLLERASRFDEAGATYAALVADFPASTWRSDADFRRGLVQYKAANYAGAALSWSVIASSPAGTMRSARASGMRVLDASSDPLADAVLAQLIDDPDAAGDFYALRAEVLLGKNITKESTPKLSDFTLEKLDWKKIADYVEEIAGVDPRSAVTRLTEDGRFDEGAALEDVGLHAQSDAVYRAIIRDNKDDLAALYQLALRFSEQKRTSLAARAAVTLIAALPETAATPPDDLRRVAYPPYGALVRRRQRMRTSRHCCPGAGGRRLLRCGAAPAPVLGLTQVVPAQRSDRGQARRGGIRCERSLPAEDQPAVRRQLPEDAARRVGWQRLPRARRVQRWPGRRVRRCGRRRC